MQVHYLEIVTPDVDATCATQAEVHGLRFGEPDPMLGGARTAPLAGGGTVGVRAPMHETEVPVARPYFLVDDVAAAHARAVAGGAEEMHPPMEIPGKGHFSILHQGGVQFGLWQD